MTAAIAPIIEVGHATAPERRWAAGLMAASEPWITLQRDLAGCQAVLADLPDTTLYVARADARPLGFVLLRPRGLAGAPYIVSIAVDPAARGRGIGTRLMDHVIEVVSPPARHLFLCVSDFNAAARRLYERYGFREVGSVSDYLVPGVAELILHKRLAP